MKSLIETLFPVWHGRSAVGIALLLGWTTGWAVAEEKMDAANAALLPATQSQDYASGFGVGAILGDPTGLSLKGWLSDRTAIDGGVAWSFPKRGSLQLHSDFLFHYFDLFPVEKGKLPLYFGVGGRVLFERNRDTRAGVRTPVGLAYMFEDTPLDIFVEIAPVLDLVPSKRFSLNGGIGVRYYFR